MVFFAFFRKIWVNQITKQRIRLCVADNPPLLFSQLTP